MSKIVMSVAGAGRGHATRVRSLVELQRREHGVLLLASNATFELLSESYRQHDEVSVRWIPGGSFSYTAGG